MAKKTIHFVSLGCAKNRVDTEVMLGVGAEAGFLLTGSPSDADVIVVNTCAFIRPAKEESIETILSLAKERANGRCRKLVVAGCLAQRYAGELAEEIPEVDHLLGSSDMLKLRAVLAGGADRILVGNPADYSLRATDPRLLSEARHTAYVKIAEGCNRRCSFCAIPAIRGKQRSRPIADVVKEVRRLVGEGLVEANLVSQDSTAYGRDLADRPSLATLVRAVAGVKGLRWLRLNYLYPEALDAELLALLSDGGVVLPYIDMPLQHASDAMLRRMRRGHGGARLYKVVETLRARLPRTSFRSAFIVGHPGETAADFAELCRFVEWAELDHVGAFKYSHEEGTASAAMTDLVAPREADRRYRHLMAIQRTVSRKKQRELVGQELDVLVDGESDESEFLLEGRWWAQAPEVDGKIHLANGVARPGEIRRARITHAADYDLVADLLPAPGAPRTRRLPLAR